MPAPIEVFARVLFNPSTVKSEIPNHGVSKQFSWPMLGGVGLSIHFLYITPKIIRGLGPEWDIIVSKISGFIIGFIMLLLLYLIDVIIVSAFKIKSASRVILASNVVWILLPAVAIPMHALFPLGLINQGLIYLPFSLIVIFLIWRASIQAILYANGHHKSRSGITKEKILTLFVVMISVELTLSFAFLCYALPALANSDFLDVLSLWL
ncbi:MAG: hypothetical protein ACTSWN_12875 [Promethearchaeota archaeon]